MNLQDFKKTLLDLKEALNRIIRNNIKINLSSNRKIYDFKRTQEDYFIKSFLIALKKAKNQIIEMTTYSSSDTSLLIRKISSNLIKIEDLFSSGNENIGKISNILAETFDLVDEIKVPEMEKLDFKIPKLPPEIREYIIADIHEMKKCFFNSCYRSAIILCGRVLEIALHRKYYESTGTDLLEKAPGIGLGNLVAKLKERGISLDPAITQQIHLVNQLRIFSIHRKKELFIPTREQTQAIILYTLEIIKKLFK